MQEEGTGNFTGRNFWYQGVELSRGMVLTIRPFSDDAKDIIPEILNID